MRQGRVTLLVLLLAAAVGIAVLGLRSHPAARPAAAAPKSKPNLVFVLTDDLSWNLINRRFAPHIVALAKRGVTFNHYFVADSLCCPSRATIFTGLFPHTTKVVTNTAPTGGFDKFQAEGLDRRTWAVALQRHGYRNSMLGKYLNHYGDPQMTSATAPIPPGWSDWHVSNGSGYLEFNYVLNENGTVNAYGGPTGLCGISGTPDNYGVDVIGSRAQSFIAASRRRPFAVEIATFAPHKPYTPAPRNACDFPGLEQPRDRSFDTNNVHPPAWLGHRKPLTNGQISNLDAKFRLRAQAVEAVDRLVANIERTLAANHLANKTYIVFSSDNGYHMGQHRLPQGKQTAFDTDIRVPLIIAGPGVPHGRVASAVTQNVDLYPTFLELAGGSPGPSIEGRSLVPLIHGRPPRWRTVALIEHRGNNTNPLDPDFEGKGSANPTTYEAIRISAKRLRGFKRPVEAVYVEYKDPAHEREYYDIRKDPYERVNIVDRLTRAQLRELHRILHRLERCHNGRTCWSAGMPR